MAERETEQIGQLLLERGWITSKQLSTALIRQRELGGRLGTALLEMGVLSEDTLVKTLAEQSALPLADIDELREIPTEVLDLLPAKVAIRHGAIPFRAGRGRVSIAVRSEPDIPALDELAFVLGRRVVVHIANEARIHVALERYYGEDCPIRFKQLLERLNHSRDHPDEEAARVAAASETPQRRQRRRETPAEAPAEAVAPPPPSQEEVQRALQAARRADDIGAALLGYLSQEFLRLFLFRVGHGSVRGWMGRSPAFDEYGFRNWTVGFDEPSVFLNLRQGAEFFLGRLPAMPAHQRLLKCWRGSMDTECAVFPVRVRDRLVCAVYGDRDSLGLAGLDVPTVQRLAGKAAIAFEMLLMQRKLRS